jgi:hypothetical protein
MEIWKEITGFNDYQVSDQGQVRSTKYKKPRILKPGNVGKGHLQVTLMRDSRKHKMLVHRLVAAAFIPQKEEHLIFIDHMNGVPADNRAENLRWVTNRMNLQNRNDNREGRTASSYAGVSFRRRDSAWIARIYIEGKNILLGNFDTQEEGAFAYDAALLKLGLEPVNFNHA